MLQQPFADVLRSGRNVLLAGCGGGYDIVGAVPLVIDLLAMGKTVTLASLSFTRLDQVPGHRRIADVPHLYVTTADGASEDVYCPEAWLSQWLKERVGRDVPIWCFENVGVRPLREMYRHVLQENAIDTLVLIDGGVDSLLRGDETSLGTPIEDLATLAAVESLELPRKMLACVGFGAELRDGVQHAQVLDRIAYLTSIGAWLGVSALLKGAPIAQDYLAAVEFIARHQSRQKGSHIHSVVSRSLLGGFGATAPFVWLSPLAAIYWFFQLDPVARTNLLVSHIQNSETLWDIAATIEGVRKSIAVRPAATIPL